MRRREFLSSLSTIGLAAAATQLGCTPSVRAGESTVGRRRLRRVGVQLYSLRDDAARDLERTLADIAATGYRDVELLGSFNNFGMPPARLRQVLDRNGLRAPSTHVGGNALDQLDRNIDEALTLGHQYIVLASLPIQGQRTLDDYHRWADRLNEAGQVTLRRGIRMAFHNHANDLTPINGTVPYDILLDRTDPSVVRHQLDTGNTAMAGRDPMEYMQRYGSRFWLFHIKDVPRLGPTNDTELGTGVINFRRLLASIDNIDDKHLFVEQETYPGTPLESVRRDYTYISTLEF
jgi:sugar phosphate isomerase/epimerase